MMYIKRLFLLFLLLGKCLSSHGQERLPAYNQAYKHVKHDLLHLSKNKEFSIFFGSTKKLYLTIDPEVDEYYLPLLSSDSTDCMYYPFESRELFFNKGRIQFTDSITWEKFLNSNSCNSEPTARMHFSSMFEGYLSVMVVPLKGPGKDSSFIPYVLFYEFKFDDDNGLICVKRRYGQH